MIEENPILFDKGELIRIEKKLCGANVRSACPFVGCVQIGLEAAFVIVGCEFASVNFATLVIERRKDQRFAELTLVEDRVRAFVEAIDAYIEAFGNFLRCAGIEVVSTLRFHDGVFVNGGFVSRASELRDGGLAHLLQWRRCEITRKAGMQGGSAEWLLDDVDSRTELILVRERVHDIEATAEIDGELFERLPFILQIEPIEIAVLAAVIHDAQRDIACLVAIGVDRKDKGSRSDRGVLFREKESAAQCVLIGQLVARVELETIRENVAINARSNAV